MTDEPSVRVAVDQWLGRIDSKLDHIQASLDSKADRGRVHTLENNVAAMGLRVQALEQGSIKRNGPIVTQLAEMSTLVHDLSRDQARFQRTVRWIGYAGIPTVVALLAIILSHVLH